MESNSQELTPDTFLPPVRCLDLTDEKGFLCGRILADLGMDVLKVERPGGDCARSIGPFYQNTHEPEKSLSWFAFNVNKRGITLDIETEDGQELFKDLAKSADIVIESFSPGYMDSQGLGYQQLSEINPSIIVTSITGFGQTGPHRNYKTCDLVANCMGGLQFVTGDPDRPPIRTGFHPQAYLVAGAEAAAATMLAYYYRATTGEGQFVDISIQDVQLWNLMQVANYWSVLGQIGQRSGSRWRTTATGVTSPLVWPCRDGYVTMPLWGGAEGKRLWFLAKWMSEEGMAPDFIERMTQEDWEGSFALAVATQDNVDRVSEAIGKFFLSHTKEEIFREALNRDIQIFPVFTPADILSDPQLSARDFWVDLEHPELGITIAYPGPFIKASETAIKLRCRAPLIGEQNEEVYGGELGISKQRLDRLKERGII